MAAHHTTLIKLSGGGSQTADVEAKEEIYSLKPIVLSMIFPIWEGEPLKEMMVGGAEEGVKMAKMEAKQSSEFPVEQCSTK